MIGRGSADRLIPRCPQPSRILSAIISSGTRCAAPSPSQTGATVAPSRTQRGAAGRGVIFQDDSPPEEASPYLPRLERSPRCLRRAEEARGASRVRAGVRHGDQRLPSLPSLVPWCGGSGGPATDRERCTPRPSAATQPVSLPAGESSGSSTHERALPRSAALREPWCTHHPGGHHDLLLHAPLPPRDRACGTAGAGCLLARGGTADPGLVRGPGRLADARR